MARPCNVRAPFRLEPPKKEVGSRRTDRVIYTKNRYGRSVKVQDWERYRESHPLDSDPYCPGEQNYFLSHYKRLGTDCEAFSAATTTGDMLGQIYTKRELPGPKRVYNFYTYAESSDCAMDGTYDDFCADEYLTTMQDHFSPPYPYTLRRVAFPVIPYLQNRRFKHDDPLLSPFKFYDEGFPAEVCKLRKAKGFHHRSFNPMTSEYNNEHFTEKPAQ